MRVRIVVADQGEAAFYDFDSLEREQGLQVVGRMEDPIAHLHDRDLQSDRPGSKNDRAPVSGGRRGATAHHGTGGERSPRKHEAHEFARHIVQTLERAYQAGQFERLVIMAGPPFLGLLREALPDSFRPIILAEVPKDLAHQPEKAVMEHLPPAAFRRA